jgi:hypothetical protein
VNREVACKIADAVMYEGYMLYPYRSSALKNRQRWSFGILYPLDYEEVHRGTERSSMHSECLLRDTADCKLRVTLRFLQLARKVHPDASSDAEASDEPFPRSLEFESDLSRQPAHRFEFSFPESISPGARQEHLRGAVTTAMERLAPGLLKLTVDVLNETGSSDNPADKRNRDCALLQAFLSAHLILQTHGGEFVSLLDPGEEFIAQAHACRNVGNFPVLVGNDGERDTMLCSSIILYDYPQIAPESAGEFFDATEMDEMLTLRVITLSDSEKDQMRSANDHVRTLLERTELSTREQLMRTHGVIRSLRPVRDDTPRPSSSAPGDLRRD